MELRSHNVHLAKQNAAGVYVRHRPETTLLFSGNRQYNVNVSYTQTSANVSAGEKAELIDGKIHLGMYSALHPIEVELSISGLRAHTTVKLEREEHSGYWGTATGACKPPGSLGVWNV